MTRPILRTRLLLGLLLLMIWIALSPIVLGTSTRGLAAPLPHVTALPTAPLPASFPIVVKVIKSANVRSGPGTEYPVISGARPGQRLNVVDCNLDCSWYKLADDCWIAAFLVQPEISVGVSQPFPTVIVSTVITSPLPPSVDSTPAVGIELPQQSVPQPSLQPTQCPQTMRTVNTHAGPGTFYPVVDTRPAGECIAVIGRNSVGDWFQMSHGMWIAASAILYAEPIETMPITDALFTATPEPTPTPVPVLEPTSETIIPQANQPIGNTTGGGGNSQPFVCTNGCATPPNPSCNIKGNADSGIYHTPSSRYYDRTTVDSFDGDVWFCSEAEARSAGYRPPEQ